ncbi:hypothetical protein BDV95DRAFT_637006 [Massariosphaeria phaeospora]|uniref:F-box domain-containing protein n=1 Tax=Massariosphaeria phaeospora TaxID=100035 RepID=A0A7C8I858_9PLEO|nr:hypothetical protein BDV95DRAFT_637006 [Massariosphaeria phaeospora]
MKEPPNYASQPRRVEQSHKSVQHFSISALSQPVYQSLDIHLVPQTSTCHQSGPRRNVSSKGLESIGFANVSEEDASKDRAATEEPAPEILPVDQPKPRSRKPIVKGEKEPYFRFSPSSWDGGTSKYYDVIGTCTRKLVFGYGFKLTDEHVDDFVAMGPPVCGKLLTEAGILKLAEACPKLRRIHLPDTSNIKDQTFIDLLRLCPQLAHVEICGGLANDEGAVLTSEIFQTLEDNTDLCPKLKKLRLQESRKTKFMNAMRKLTRARPGLVVELVDMHQEKKWGDWDIVESKTSYKKGRELRGC